MGSPTLFPVIRLLVVAQIPCLVLVF